MATKKKKIVLSMQERGISAVERGEMIKQSGWSQVPV